MEASVTFKNISKRFEKKYVLSSLTLGIEKGSAFAIIGRDGAGKSTLLRILATLLTPDDGKVYIDGKDISNYTAEAKRSIGYLPDHDMHDPWLTGWENLVLRAEFLDIKKSEIENRINPLLQEFEIGEEIQNYPVTYSHGMKRRLDIIQVLLGDPSILLLDEPTLGLDYHIRNIFFKYLLKQKGKKTIIVASNEFTEIQTIADRWVVLHHGEIRYDGTLEKMSSLVEIPFVGTLEFKNCKKSIVELVKNIEGVKEVREIGKTILIQIDGLKTFCNIFSKIDTDDIIGIRGYSIRIEEFLERLLSDEGY